MERDMIVILGLVILWRSPATRRSKPKAAATRPRAASSKPSRS